MTNQYRPLCIYVHVASNKIHHRVKEGTEDWDTVLDDLTRYGEQLIVKTCVNLEAQNTIPTKKVDTKTLDKDTNEAKQHAKYQGRKHRRTQLTP